jgi:hypothetical protein
VQPVVDDSATTALLAGFAQRLKAGAARAS